MEETTVKTKKKISPLLYAAAALLVLAIAAVLYVRMKPDHPRETVEKYFRLQNEIYEAQSQEEVEQTLRELYGMQYPSLDMLAEWYDAESEAVFFRMMAQSFYDGVKRMDEEQRALYHTEAEIRTVTKMSRVEIDENLHILPEEFGLKTSQVQEAYAVNALVKLPATEYESKLTVYCLDGKWYLLD